MTLDRGLQYVVDGPQDAPVLVLGSSLGTTGAMWQPQVSTLASRFRLIRYDHRGHGGSPVPPGPYRIDELGGDLLGLLDRLGLERVHLGGLSLGGMVAMWVAATAPERVERLGLVCTSARLGPAHGWAERAAAVRADGTASLADVVLGRWFTPGFAAGNPAVVAWARRLITTTPAEGYAACCEAIGAMDLTGMLDRIGAPTLVIAGADDPAIPPEHGAAIAAAVPTARFEIVPDAAHLANVEQPGTIGRLLLDFYGRD